MYIDSSVKEIDFDDIRQSADSEITFADPFGWEIRYSEVISDNMMEYSQSAGRGEISGSCIRTVGHGTLDIEFSSDGKSNMEKLKQYRNACPGYSYPVRHYDKLVKKD